MVKYQNSEPGIRNPIPAIPGFGWEIGSLIPGIPGSWSLGSQSSIPGILGLIPGIPAGSWSLGSRSSIPGIPAGICVGLSEGYGVDVWDSMGFQQCELYV